MQDVIEYFVVLLWTSTFEECLSVLYSGACNSWLSLSVLPCVGYCVIVCLSITPLCSECLRRLLLLIFPFFYLLVSVFHICLYSLSLDASVKGVFDCFWATVVPKAWELKTFVLFGPCIRCIWGVIYRMRIKHSMWTRHDSALHRLSLFMTVLSDKIIIFQMKKWRVWELNTLQKIKSELKSESFWTLESCLPQCFALCFRKSENYHVSLMLFEVKATTILFVGLPFKIRKIINLCNFLY